MQFLFCFPRRVLRMCLCLRLSSCSSLSLWVLCVAESQHAKTAKSRTSIWTFPWSFHWHTHHSLSLKTAFMISYSSLHPSLQSSVDTPRIWTHLSVSYADYSSSSPPHTHTSTSHIWVLFTLILSLSVEEQLQSQIAVVLLSPDSGWWILLCAQQVCQSPFTWFSRLLRSWTELVWMVREWSLTSSTREKLWTCLL